MRHIVVVSMLAMLSCAARETSFRGSPKIPNGAAGCQARCSSYGMELAGMVALGDYSDGCICEVPGRRSASASAAASGASAAAVMEQIRLERQYANEQLVQPPPQIFLPPLVPGASDRAHCSDSEVIATAAAMPEPR